MSASRILSPLSIRQVLLVLVCVIVLPVSAILAWVLFEDPRTGDLEKWQAHAVVILALAMGLLVALAWWIGSAIAEPTCELAGLAARIGEGDLSVRAPLQGPAEIQDLARQFNRMLDALAQSSEANRVAMADLARSEKRFRSVFEQQFQFMALLSPEGIVQDVTHVLELSPTTSAPRETVIGKLLWDCVWWARQPEVRKIWPERLKMAAALQGPYLFEDTFHSPSGEFRWAEASVTAIRDEHGEIELFIVQGHDVTERKQAQQSAERLNAELEERVRKRTEQLQSANQELEAFSHSIAHDLRAPLSVLDGFSHLLDRSMVGEKNERIRHYLARIRACTKQMGDTTAALLALAQISRTRLSWGSVDLGLMAQDVLDECRKREPNRKVRCHVQQPMMAMGDALLLRVVMQHLIGNAWKFSARRETAEINVVCETGRDGAAVFAVKDNGVGFDMAYAQKLFGTFQRLHSPQDFEGSGLGLANVRRIILRHGGRIWAEALPGKGASFFFTLGRSAPEDPPRMLPNA